MRRKKLCKGCKEFFRPNDNDPEKIAHCSPDCAIDIVSRNRAVGINNAVKSMERAKKKAKQVNTKARLDLKKNNHSYQFGLTKKAAQTLANRIDQDKSCICCGKMRGTVQFCGGHYKTAGGHPELALDLRNIHGQANQLCNMQKSGNLSGDKHSYGYTEGLRLRYGDNMVNYLNGPHPTVKRTCEELIELRATYAKEIRYIEQHGEPSKDWRNLDN